MSLVDGLPCCSCSPLCSKVDVDDLDARSRRVKRGQRSELFAAGGSLFVSVGVP